MIMVNAVLEQNRINLTRKAFETPCSQKICSFSLKYVCARGSLSCSQSWRKQNYSSTEQLPTPSLSGAVRVALQTVFPNRTAAELCTTQHFMVSLYHVEAVNTVLVIAIFCTKHKGGRFRNVYKYLCGVLVLLAASSCVGLTHIPCIPPPLVFLCRYDA